MIYKDNIPMYMRTCLTMILCLVIINLHLVRCSIITTYCTGSAELTLEFSKTLPDYCTRCRF